jgi:unsaturated chondroitin disaccharide hydrolase
MKKPIKKAYLIFAAFLMFGLASCSPSESKEKLPYTSVIEQSAFQYNGLVKWGKENQMIPRSVKNDEVKPIHSVFDWTAGFFPGSLWYLYELSGDSKWADEAKYFQDLHSEMRFFKGSHDLGFVFNNSYGHAYRLSNDQNYLNLLIEAGDVLIQRFNPNVGALQSWDIHGGWQSKRGWSYPVIIDNMMNLELLFRLSEWTGDSKYREIAIKHANTTLTHFFRDNHSSYHVVDFNPETGEPLAKETAQGYAHESSWSRGQAWGLYGFVSTYAFTKDPRYLEIAENIAAYYLNHKHLPEDLIPHWDLSIVPNPEVVKDASAAAIVASALVQLDEFSDKDYLTVAKKIISSLSSKKYLAEIGENHHFLIKHCTGSIPHSEEIDVPLNYADYYFLEAIYRIRNN